MADRSEGAKTKEGEICQGKHGSGVTETACSNAPTGSVRPTVGAAEGTVKTMTAFKKTAFYLLLLSIVLKLAGFLRESVIAGEFGASRVTDGFLLAYNLLTLFMLIVATGFNNVFLPLYVKSRAADPTATERSANALLNRSLLLFFLLGLLFYVGLPVIAPYALGFTNEPTRLTVVEAGRFFGLFLFLFALTGILESYLQARYVFVPTQIAKLAGTLGSALFGLWFSNRYGIMSLAYGFAVGTAVGVALQGFYLYKTGFKWRPQLNWNPRFGEAFFVMLWPALLDTLVGPINSFADKLFATSSIAGAVTYLNNASLIASLPTALYATAIASILFTQMTEAARSPSFINLISNGVQSALLILVPVAAGLVIASGDIVSLIYERGAFTAHDTAETADVLALYAPLVAAQGAQAVIAKAFFALERARTLLKISVTTIAANLLLNALFMLWLGYKGLALSSSLVSLYFVTASAYVLYKPYDRRKWKALWQGLLKIIPPTAIMVLSLVLTRQAVFLPLPPFWRVMAECAFGAAVYGLATWFLNRSGFWLIKGGWKGSQP